ncbi:hypothetical protein EUTSA_v10001088mg [Eutrema salsugineum]|uniref:Uncharacterized protein n=1 Tax=Eutrema salsugineum TaxID=72664 RepID=V4L7C2_EUTSA|nr:hypothetical protein EUTSA_v10001088mg [Eutrema salsugineum]
MGSSQITQVLFVLLLLCVFPCLTESALPSHSITGRRMLDYYQHIPTRPGYPPKRQDGDHIGNTIILYICFLLN